MRKTTFLAAVLALVVAAFAHADTALGTVTDRGWQPMRGTTNVGTPVASEAACWQALAAWSEANRASITTARCRNDKARSIAYSVPPPPPPCPSAPAPQTQQAACPAGTTGSFTQTRAATVGAAPACAVAWSEWAPANAPAGACVTPPPPPPPPAGAVLYFSDCQAGAAAGCLPGNDANPGTEAAPKRVPTTAQINALPAGGAILLNRGGAWAMSSILEFHNLNATPAAPIVMDAYGSGAAPVLTFSAPIGLQFGGRWGNTTNDGGYTVRNVVLRGLNADTADTRGIWLVQTVRNVTLEGIEVAGWRTGLQIQPAAPGSVTGFVLRNSRVIGSRSFGMLFSADDSVIEANHFEGNNTVGNAMLHALYINGGGRNNVIRGNRFVRNSVVGGVCTGGNVTAHGNIDGMLVEGNTIEQDGGTDQCGGFNFTAAYPEVEAFRGLVIRGNTIANVGPGAIILDSAPGVVIEGNRSFNATGRSHTLAWNYGSASETPMTDPVVRNNVLCGPGAITNLPGAVVSGNVQRTGADATTGACAR